MYHIREFYQQPLPTKRVTAKMDPDCAICHAPATLACDCEAKGLETAVRQAEARMMQGICNDIRTWVRAHAQDYILSYFRLLSERRKVAHTAHIDRITQHAALYYRAAPHPSELDAAQRELKRLIDEDWQASVQRYPEVLQYYYSLVEFTLPADDAPSVRDPPLSALGGSRQVLPKRRLGPADDGAATIASGRSFAMERTPPGFAPPRGEGRTPGPPETDRRRSFSRIPPHPANYYPHSNYPF